MASSKSLESRWIRRYRVFFLLGSVILSVQVFLAYTFFPVDVEENVQNQKETLGKVNVEILNDNLNVGVSSRKFKERFLVNDDEDSPSNSNLVNGLFKKHKVPPDKFDSLSDNRRNTVTMDKVPPHVNLKNSRSVVNKTILRLGELDFVPPCDIVTKEAVSAIHRAKTQRCKQEIVNITCLIQQGQLYPSYLPNSCPSSGFMAGKSLGCFRDNKTFRLLSGYYANLKTTNSPQHCINMCLQSGFPYAGVQFSTQCFCGNEAPPSTSRLPDSSCNMKCPADPRKACGGSFSVNVYESGIAKFVPQVPKETPESVEHPARIVFLLTLNGRALRQVQRLIKALFHVDHYFYIHVDARQDYLFRELLPLEKSLPNVRLARQRYATIWGGASLLQMLLASMTELVKIDWHWDFVINLSESDFPVKTNVQLVEFLTANKERNFVKSHGREVQRFIQKQGLDKTFVECDAHMWRVGDRHLPWGVEMDGGSDWVALSRSFVSYVTDAVDENANKDQLLQGLSAVFKYTLLPAETFFHTVLRNSKFCNTYVDNNLHVTNWKRRLGCKCQYKHIVDWCGCSPNDFKPDDWPRLQGTEGRQLFFARKFEPVISQAIIDQVEDWLYGPFPSSIPSVQRYWQSFYHHADLSPLPDDALLTLSMSFARLASSIVSSNGCNVQPSKVLEVTSYHQRDTYMGTLVMFEGDSGDGKVRMETWVQPVSYMSITKSTGIIERLKFLQISSEYDQKEQVSRNFIRALGPFSEPVLIYEFRPRTDSVSSNYNGNSGKSGTNITVLWIDPAGHIVDVTDVHLDGTSTIGSLKPFLREPLLPGVWDVKLLHRGSEVACTQFLITPLQFTSGTEISQQQAGFLHSVPNISRDMSQWDKHIKNIDRSALRRKALLNSRRFGVDLKEWIDSLATRFYKVFKSCLVSSDQIFKQQLCSNLDGFCSMQPWSSVFPDPKCNITTVNQTTGTLNRW